MLARDRKEITREHDPFADLRNAIVRGREEFARDRNAIACKRNAIMCDRNAITCERDVITCDHNVITHDRAAITTRREAIAYEGDATLRDRKTIRRDHEPITGEHTAIVREGDRITRGRRPSAFEPLTALFALLSFSCRHGTTSNGPPPTLEENPSSDVDVTPSCADASYELVGARATKPRCALRSTWTSRRCRSILSGMRDPELFAKAFADHWAAPSVDGLKVLLTDDVRLVQPMSKPAIGIEAAKRWLAGVLAMIPDIRAEVDRWSATGESVFIEFRLIGTIAGRRVEWPVVDRFLLADDNRARDRVSYFDPLPLLSAGLRSPTGWLQLLRTALS